MESYANVPVKYELYSHIGEGQNDIPYDYLSLHGIGGKITTLMIIYHPLG